MANRFLTISEITYEAAMILKNTCKFASRCDRRYDDRFAQAGAKIGDSINIRKPWRPVGRTTMTANFEGVYEPYVTLTLDHPFGVDMNFSTIDLTLNMDDFRRRYITPAVVKIANYVDEVGMALYDQIPWMLGTPGTTPNTLLPFSRGAAVLTEEGFPRDNFEDMRTMLLNPETMAVMADAKSGLFNPQGAISEQYRTGLMSLAAGWSWFESPNTVVHTVGQQGGTPAVNGNNQTGSSLITNGWTSAAANRLKKGDVFTIAGVYAVNPQNRLSTGRLRQFVATADVDSDSSGNATIPIYPEITPINADGTHPQFQTVTVSPTSGALLTVVGTGGAVSAQSLGFYRDAITLAMVDLELPPAIPANAKERVSDPESGISIRMYQYQDGVHDVSGARLDILFGYRIVYPEGCVRIAA
jgi:hypothetical protein